MRYFFVESFLIFEFKLPNQQAFPKNKWTKYVLWFFILIILLHFNNHVPIFIIHLSVQLNLLNFINNFLIYFFTIRNNIFCFSDVIHHFLIIRKLIQFIKFHLDKFALSCVFLNNEIFSTLRFLSIPMILSKIFLASFFLLFFTKSLAF